MSAPTTCLLLDDDLVSGLTFEVLLEDEGHTVSRATTLAAARDWLRTTVFGLVVLDVHLPDGLGPDLLPEVRRHSPGAVVIVLSGSITAGQTFEDVEHVLSKGMDPGEALAVISEALARGRAT